MDLTSVAANAERFGIGAGVRDLVARVARRAADVRVLRCLELNRVTAIDVSPRLSPFERVRWGELAPDLLRAHAGAEWDLDEALVGHIEARGDRCFGYLVDGHLAHYELFSRSATPIEPGLMFSGPPGAVVGYKAFTHPGFRGRRLHAASVYGVLMHVAQEGARAIVSYVASNNFESARSHARVGFVDRGSVLVLGHGGTASVHVGARARRHGIAVRTVPTRAMGAELTPG